MGFLKLDIPYDLDSPERTLYHRKIILNKRFLKKLYDEWYSVFMKAKRNLPEGKIIELGSGGGFLKDVCPEVITSDVIPLECNDMTFSALEMPFENDSVAAIFMIDTFHHLPDTGLFLKEAERVLVEGGKIIMIEPANSLWGRFIYQNFHHEPFVPEGGWVIPSTGPLSDANGALPWIVFERDQQKLKNKYPNLETKNIEYHTPLRYLLSGGVSMRQLLPDFLFGGITLLEKILKPLSKVFSMFMTIEVQKRTP